MLALKTFLDACDAILPHVTTPPGYAAQDAGPSRAVGAASVSPSMSAAATSLPLLDFCRQQVVEGQTTGYDQALVAQCVSGLNAYGGNGADLLARLYAARYSSQLGRYADILLDEIRAHNPALAFEVNVQSYTAYHIHMSAGSPLRYETLTDYLDAVSELSTKHGYKPQGGQNFGL